MMTRLLGLPHRGGWPVCSSVCPAGEPGGTLDKDVHDAGESATRRKKAASKTKYTCPGCEANAWAKPGTSLICGDCSEAMIAQDPDDAQAGTDAD